MRMQAHTIRSSGAQPASGVRRRQDLEPRLDIRGRHRTQAELNRLNQEIKILEDNQQISQQVDQVECIKSTIHEVIKCLLAGDTRKDLLSPQETLLERRSFRDWRIWKTLRLHAENW